MMHIIFSAAGWQKAHPYITDQDTVLFCGSALACLHDAPLGCERYALAVDCRQVGIEAPETVQVIDDDAWVTLMVNHPQRVTWS